MRNMVRWIALWGLGLGGIGVSLGLAGCKPAATAPRPERGGWFIDAERYRRSVHGRVECLGCHTEQELVPPSEPEVEAPPRRHGQELARAWRPAFDGCKSCHPYEYSQFQGGSHGLALAELAPGYPDCATCHSAHYGQPRLDRRQAAALQLERCGFCHRQDLPLNKLHLTPGHRPEDGLSCGTCHGVHAAQKLTASLQDQPVCQDCHAHLQKGIRHAAK